MKGVILLGLAKYMEDNEEIINIRMYDKGIGIVELNDFKKAQKGNARLISAEEEYLSVLKELEKIERWLYIIENSMKIIKTEFILQTMYNQKKQYNLVKNEYINYKFDPKFREFRDKQFSIDEKEIKEYERKIIKSYIQYFIDNLKTMKNFTDDDAVAINFLYWDIEEFVKEFLSIDVQDLHIPFVQYLRENILYDNEKTWVLCPNCKQKTYGDFNTCIHCKYPNEVI